MSFRVDDETKVDKAPLATVDLQIPFHDLDPMQIVWHGNYMKYFEHTRQKLFDNSGVDLYRVAREQGYIFPIVKTSVKYIKPLRFRDRISVTAQLKEARRMIVLEFSITRQPDGELCARATSEQLAVRADDQRLLFNIPEKIRNALMGNPS